MSREIEIRTVATATVIEEWIVEVPDDYEMPTDDESLLGLLDDDSLATFISVQNVSVDDERDRTLASVYDTGARAGAGAWIKA